LSGSGSADPIEYGSNPDPKQGVKGGGYYLLVCL